MAVSGIAVQSLRRDDDRRLVLVERAHGEPGLARAAARGLDAQLEPAERQPCLAAEGTLQRDPVRPQDIVHVDLYEVNADEKIIVKVPVHLTGTADGVPELGGAATQMLEPYGPG